MLRSFLTITARILWRNKVSSFVNIFSLSTGIVSFMFIMLYVHHETSFDTFNLNYDHMYRLEADDYARLPPVIGTYVKERVPEIKELTRVNSFDEPIGYRSGQKAEEFKYAKTDVLSADNSIFDIFTLEIIKGDRTSALTRPFTIVITEKVANTLFGETDPVGQVVEFHNQEFTVTGVMKDVPKSHLPTGAIFSFESIEKMFPDNDPNNTARSSWLWSATYFVTRNSIDVPVVESKIDTVLAAINKGQVFDTKFNDFRVRPLKEVYFDGSLQRLDYGLHGNSGMISTLFVLGIFILALACINYVNLTTARSSIRNKEIALKQTLGSSVGLIRTHLLLESIIVSVISLLVALTFGQVLVNKFNDLANINIRLADLNRWEIWIGALGGAALLGLLAGTYPALYLTAAKPVSLLKGAAPNNSTSISFRSVLMTFQFALSIILIASTLANFRQLNFIRNVDLGFNKEQLVQISLGARDTYEEFTLRELFKKELLREPNIKGVSYSSASPVGTPLTVPMKFEGVQHIIGYHLIDHDYLDVMNIALVEGTGYTPLDFEKFTEDRFSILVNESLVREFNLQSPLGKTFYWDNAGTLVPCEITGVVKDYHFQSLHHKISPLIFIQTPPMGLVNIRIQPSNIPATIKTIERIWKKLEPDRPIDIHFLDDMLERQYQSDEQIAAAISAFTGLALIIACLGLFALASFMIDRRTKEIGIRKAMGASVKSIYVMISWDFLKLVMLAVIIACPLSWLFIRQWLEGFSYHIELRADIFVIAAVLALGISLLTITWQSLKAASSSPIKALRYE